MGHDAIVAYWRRLGHGSLIGIALAVALVGAGEAASNYLPTHPIWGIGLGAAAGLGAFVAGVAWDRRKAHRERDQRWRELFMSYSWTRGDDAEGDGVLARLAPWRSPVPFDKHRLSQVWAIRRWCIDRQSGRVWLLAGGPGSGKTRLAMRLAEVLGNDKASRWDSRFARTSGAAAIELAKGWHRPVLVIVDDAETRSDLAEILTALRDASGQQEVRLLLIARHFGDWWISVQQPLQLVDVAPDMTRLGPLGKTVPAQQLAAKSAVTAYANEYNVDPARVRVTGMRSSTPLLVLHAAALEGVLLATEGQPKRVDVAHAITAILSRERQAWRDHAYRRGLTAYPQVTDTVLQNVLVLTALIGVKDGHDPTSLLNAVRGLDNATPELVERVAAWLRLYPQVVGYRLRPHLPSIFVEYLTAQVLAQDEALAAAVASVAQTPEQAHSVISMLTRAASHTEAGSAAVSMIIAADPIRLIPIAIELADEGPIDQAIAEAINRADIDWYAANQLYQQLPGDTIARMHTAIALTRTLVRSAPSRSSRAMALSAQATALRLMGRLDDIVTTATSAVDHWRKQAARKPDVNQPSLAKAMCQQADALRQAGRLGQAISVATEAVDLWRKLVAADPGAYKHFLVTALTLRSAALRSAGRLHEAVAAASEAVDLGKQLDTRADEHRRSLADALVDQAETLRLAGHDGEAVAAASAAVDLWQQIALTHPDPHQPFLAHALSIQSSVLQQAGSLGGWCFS